MTAPPFCAMPSWSSTVTPLPSMCAAVPMMAPMVTTPVPPMPVISTPYGLSASDGSRGGGGRGGRQRRPRRRHAGFLAVGLALADAAAFDRDEARAEAVEAGEVLVAGRLVDGALVAELGLDRHDAEAILM